MMRLGGMFRFGRPSRLARTMAALAVFAVEVLSATAAGAQACTSPGEPVGCTEIDTPLDAQVWVLVVLAVALSAIYLRGRMPKTLA